MCVNVGVGKNMVHIGVGTICDPRQPLGSWNKSPTDEGGLLCI